MLAPQQTIMRANANLRCETRYCQYLICFLEHPTLQGRGSLIDPQEIGASPYPKYEPLSDAQAASFILCKFQLIMYQLKIISSICHQLLMRSLFHDFPMTQDEDIVGMSHR